MLYGFKNVFENICFSTLYADMARYNWVSLETLYLTFSIPWLFHSHCCHRERGREKRQWRLTHLSVPPRSLITATLSTGRKMTSATTPTPSSSLRQHQLNSPRPCPSRWNPSTGTRHRRTSSPIPWGFRRGCRAPLVERDWGRWRRPVRWCKKERWWRKRWRLVSCSAK